MTRLLPNALDRAAPEPLAEQIAAYYRRAIESGRLRRGDRLPPIREVALAAGVTRATVQDAYRRLAEGGLVQGTVGRGTTVLAVPRAAGAPAAAADATGGAPLSEAAAAAVRELRQMPGAQPLPPGRALVADFAELAPDAAHFPVDDLRASLDEVLVTRAPELLGYAHEATGLPELRELLAGRARREPGSADAVADDFLVTAGAQQALDLVLRTLCSRGDAVVVTSPSYHQMAGLLEVHGVQAVAVPWRHDGLDLEAFEQALQRPDVRLCYLMPTFHNPTGRTLDAAMRERIVAIAARTQVPVVEDEYQHELRFAGTPLRSLRSLDPRGLTVTVSTFSKGLFPGLRVGWVQGGKALLQPMAAVKRFVDLETSPLLQAALVNFTNKGALDRCLESVRVELRTRHAALQRSFEAVMPDGCTWTRAEGGYVVWLELEAAGQGDRLAELCAERGVRTVPGRVFDTFGRPSRGVRLSLSRVTETQIERGAAVLADCARQLLQSAAPPSRQFL